MPNKGNTLAISAFALLAASTSACSQTPNPIPRGTNTKYYGYIESGKKFGVSIGDTRESSQAALVSSGYDAWGDVTCEYNFRKLVDCSNWTLVELYSIDRLLFWGNLFIVIDSGEVTAIVWDMHALPKIDF